MLGSPTPVGKRPDFKQAQSGGMGWPRLVPVKDQQAQKVPTNNTPPTQRSSASPSLKDPEDRDVSPTTIEKPTSEISPQSPVLSAVETSLPGSLPAEEFATPATVEHHRSEEGGADTPPTAASYFPDLPGEVSGASVAKPDAQGAAGDATGQGELSETPSEPPNPQPIDQIRVLTDSVPYYAKPKITLQKPSESDISDISAPRTISDVLAEERLLSSEQSLPEPGGLTNVPPIPAPDWQLPEVEAPGVQVPGVSVPDVPKVAKPKKRSKAVKQTRRIAGREFILKILLGRQLAKPTKQALKMLAQGENVNLDNLAVTVV